VELRLTCPLDAGRIRGGLALIKSGELVALQFERHEEVFYVSFTS
jgi:hypothetical protein